MALNTRYQVIITNNNIFATIRGELRRSRLLLDVLEGRRKSFLWRQYFMSIDGSEDRTMYFSVKYPFSNRHKRGMLINTAAPTVARTPATRERREWGRGRHGRRQICHSKETPSARETPKYSNPRKTQGSPQERH